MADAATDLPEEEKTLKALLRSLAVCLIRTRERAEKIACLELDNYRWTFANARERPSGEINVMPEDEDDADTAFNDDVDHAQEVLEWRAIVMADLAGETMLSYAGARSPLDDPWMAWRRELPAVPAAEFVHGLTEEEFFCARVAYRIHLDLVVRRPSSVPTDGDLEDIPGCLETEPARTWREWLDVLGPRQEAVRLSLAIAAAKRDLAEGQTRSNSEVEARIAELADQVAAFQMPTIERLESIGTQVDALGAPNRFKAEEFLKKALGVEVYSSLSDDARNAALDAERRFRDRETIDWNSVVAELAKAFEIQVKQRFVPCLAEYMCGKDVSFFPDNELLYPEVAAMDAGDRDCRQRSQGGGRRAEPSGKTKLPIIKYGKAAPKLSLGSISIALGSPSPLLQEFGRTRGLDISALKGCIDGMTVDRNDAAHETRMTFAEALRLRADWLGVATSDGGIFGALLPKTG